MVLNPIAIRSRTHDCEYVPTSDAESTIKKPTSIRVLGFRRSQGPRTIRRAIRFGSVQMCLFREISYTIL
jgi:hypothetical protein